MAGFRWQPDIWPIANAIVTTVSPNAKATPNKPMPTCGNAAASTALPQPPSTSQNVPINSAANFLESGMAYPHYVIFRLLCGLRRKAENIRKKSPAPYVYNLCYMNWLRQLIDFP